MHPASAPVRNQRESSCLYRNKIVFDPCALICVHLLVSNLLFLFTRMVAALRVAPELIGIEIHFAQGARCVAQRLVVEVA